MNREYHKWTSPQLGREMELLVFGHAGQPALVFPTSMGRFWDYEERQMIAALAPALEAGRLQAFCVDSVDAESWYNKGAHPAQRALRHNQYEAYLLAEVIPFIRSNNPAPRIAVTGCSFGGYHTINFALKHPQLVNHAVSMGGAFDIHQFVDSYYDDNCYFNCPPDYLPNLEDELYLHEFRNNTQLVLATGETDICLAENLRLSGIMRGKDIPHLLDVWGEGTGHDWPWWQNMARKFFP
jgi:esterase/lipase superfamily enzyme